MMTTPEAFGYLVNGLAWFLAGSASMAWALKRERAVR